MKNKYLVEYYFKGINKAKKIAREVLGLSDNAILEHKILNRMIYESLEIEPNNKPLFFQLK